MAGKIFINYRRGDDASAAHALVGRLEQAFAPEQLFMDVDNIEPGLDFVRVLNDQVAQCDVLISIIGKNWLDARDEDGARRLDNPDDFVRIEIETALRQDKRVIPVLVGQAQMPRPDDLPDTLRPLARRNAVRLTHERFRSDAQGLIRALQDGLKEIEAQREAEAEAKRRAQTEAEQKQREAEAARQAAEEESRRRADAEALERAAAERARRQAEARQRAQAERDFSRAKRAGTVLALDGFLTAHGASPFAAEAQAVRAGLLARETAFRNAGASDDPSFLRSFIATYAKGADVDEARRRLRSLEGWHGWRPSAALMIPVGLVLVLTGGAIAYWRTAVRQPSVTENVPPAANVAPVPPKQMAVIRAPDQVAWDLLNGSSDEAKLKRFIAQYPNSARRKDAEARIAALEAARSATHPLPAPDEVTWSVLKDTTDPGALKRFIAQYPDSALRKEAEQRIAKLQAAQAAKPARPPPTPADEMAWQLMKGTSDEAELKRFVAQHPDSARREDAEARIAALDAARVPEPPPPAPDEVTWSVLKDTTDTDALKRFIARYPDSALRKQAEERMAALQAAHAAQAPQPAPADIAWNLLKDSNDPAELKRFVDEFPASKQRAQAEQRIAALTAATAKAAAVDDHALALSLQSELKRVGCFDGAMNGEFDDPTRAAQRTFAKLTSLSLPDSLSPEAIDAVRKFDKRVCPLVCPEGQRAEGQRCVASLPPKPQQRKTERGKEVPRRKPSSGRPPAQQATAQAAQPGLGRRIGPHYIVTKNGPCLVRRGHPASSCQ